MKNLLKPTSSTIHLMRAYGVNVWRSKNGLPPRFAYSPLSETAEFSYLDGRGYGPLNHRQQARYERDQHFGRQVIKHMKQIELAKELVDKSRSNAERYATQSSEDGKSE